MMHQREVGVVTGDKRQVDVNADREEQPTDEVVGPMAQDQYAHRRKGKEGDQRQGGQVHGGLVCDADQHGGGRQHDGQHRQAERGCGNGRSPGHRATPTTERSRTGTTPVTIVPSPGRDWTVRVPPSDASRSFMFWTPAPVTARSGSKLILSSVPAKRRWLSRSSRR